MPSQVTNHSPHGEDGINLREYGRVILRHRALIMGIISAGLLIAIIVVLRLPDIYEGKAVFVPLGPTKNNVQSVLGELGGLFPLGTSVSEDPSTLLIAILQSRTLAEDVIQRLNLLPLLYADDWDTNTQQWTTDEPPTIQDAVKLFREEVVTSTWDEQKGVITITAAQPDPVLAAAIVTACIEALQRSLNENSFTLAKKNRAFIEEQLHATTKNLEVIEEALKQFEQTHGIVSLDAQTQAAISALATLEAQIMAKEVQLGVLQQSLTQSSREVFLLREEVQGLRLQLARLQQGTPSPFTPSAGSGQNIQMFLSLDRAPDIKLQYARLQRESLIHNKLYTLFIQQYEQAKIDEVRDETAFQVLDRAIPPEEKAKPPRALIVLMATAAVTFVGVLLAFFRDSLDTTIRNREQVERQLGLTILATISPRLPRGQQKGWQRQQQQPLGHSFPLDYLPSEALRSFYTRLKRYQSCASGRTVVFTSSEAAEETVTTIVDLALVASGTGEKTLLIDGNFQHPMLHDFLQCPLAPGLVDLLIDPESWQKGIHQTSVKNLCFVPVGRIIPKQLVSLESPAFDVVLAHFRSTYDTILFAAPPVLSSNDTVVLSAKVEVTCLVLTYGISRVEAVIEAKASLDAVQAKAVGVILTGPQVK